MKQYETGLCQFYFKSYTRVCYLLSCREESENEENDENMNVDAFNQDDELARALSAADALGKASKSAKPETDSLTDALKELDMDHYDEEDDGIF